MSSTQQQPLVAEQVRQTGVLDAAIAATEQMMEVKALHASGKTEIIRIPAPQSLDQLTPFQIAAIMQAAPAWRDCSIEFLINVQLWCKANGLDPVTGDVYLVDGKVNTTDIAKIKFALKSGRIEYFRVGDIVTTKNPRTDAKDSYVEATLKLKDESEPRSYKAWMSEWANPKNANWQKNPTDSLQRKAMARVAHFAIPIGSEGDEFIKADAPAPAGEVLTAVTAGLSGS